MSVRKGSYVIAGTPRTTGGVEIGDMGFAPLGIDESLNLRRYLNGQVISQTQFVAFTTKVKSAVALFPSLATTESNWQSEKALSKFGQVGKFVIDDTAQTIRLPAVVNAQGLLGLSGIGNLVNESLPNITGDASLGVTGQNSQIVGHWTGTGFFSSREIIDGPAVSSGGITTGATHRFLTADASRSSSTYQDNAPVQQEAVQYPYYIQVATGVEETLPAIREYQVNNSDYFGKSMYSDIAPDNASWLASNGSYNSRSVYPDYYDWLLTQYNNPTESNVVKSGSLADNNGVLSGFSSENNALLPVTFSPANNPWEIVIKFKTPQTFSEQGLISKTHKNGMNYGLRIAFYSNGGVYYLIGSSYNTFICEGAGVQTLSVDTNYYVKFVFTGEAYKAYISTDGETWTEDFSFNTTTPIESFDEPTYLGDNKYKNIPFAGSIDLNESYININGQRWWNGRKSKVIKIGETSISSDYDFVVNQTDHTFRLPLLNGEEDLPSDRYEDWKSYITGMETDLPEAPANGYVTFFGTETATAGYLYVHNNGLNSGAGQTTDSTYRRDWVQVKKRDVVHVYINNISAVGYLRFIYAEGNGTLYYYVGDTVQDASLINAGAVLGQLSNKADIDASNFNADGKSLLSGLGMPSGRHINLTLGSSGSTYTAPANGWFCIGKQAGVDNAYIDMFNSTKAFRKQENIPLSSVYGFCFIPCSKNDVIVVNYNASGTLAYFRFIYAEGENNV